MTSCVTLSRARPRKPFRSPARIQRGELGCPDVGYPSSGDQLPGEALRPFREGRAPGEAATVVGDVAKLEFDGRSELSAKTEPRAVRLSFTLVPGVEHDLDARIGGRRRVGRRLQVADVLGQSARQRVREREDLAGAEARGLAAADARELADDLF